MSVAHTPWRYSPWHIEEGPSAVYDAKGDLVCTASSDDIARLIAAAPDLLEALEWIAAKINWEINPSNYTHQEVCDMNADWCEIGNAVDAAIAKAKAGSA